MVAPARFRHLRYPTITNPEAPPLRAERHIPNSIATASTADRRHRRQIAAMPMLRSYNGQASAESLMTQ
jgi:hypothetical protein